MGRTGYTDLPLHGGKAPRWLFNRMVKLAREMVYLIVLEFGKDNFLKKISDPFWFQAFGAVLGFDWHSSGLTTTVCGALKEGLKPVETELGLFVAGGKGAASRKTPDNILQKEKYISVSPDKLIYSSKMTAKVDNVALQDGYNLYQHTFIFTDTGKWAVVQQGMNPENRYARRYHWLSDNVSDFVVEPHTAICCDKKEEALNLVASESDEARKTITSMSSEKPVKIISELKKIQHIVLPSHHFVDIKDINPDRLYKIYLTTYEKHPENFEQLLAIKGVGPKSVRALALISELVYGSKPSYNDPVRYTFAHGGKDGHPYPVNREVYDTTIDVLNNIVNRAKIEFSDKKKALYRLYKFYENAQ